MPEFPGLNPNMSLSYSLYLNKIKKMSSKLIIIKKTIIRSNISRFVIIQ